MDYLPGNGEISVYGSEWFVASFGIQEGSKKTGPEKISGPAVKMDFETTTLVGCP
jgi:hypothetical protein